jgi:hypothetical protein
MMLDEPLLRQARASGSELAEFERRVLTARADYHTAIRRLHLAGASLREIAESLGLSHQRIQQIVDGSGGSWWRRAWSTRRARPDAVCTWCGRPPAEVARLVAGPKVYICDACVRVAERALAGSPRRAGLVRGRQASCSFCGRRRSAGRRVADVSPPVCHDCLVSCREIMQLD